MSMYGHVRYRVYLYVPYATFYQTLIMRKCELMDVSLNGVIFTVKKGKSTASNGAFRPLLSSKIEMPFLERE